MSVEGSRTLDRGLRALEILARDDGSDGLTLGELAVALDVSRPNAYRLVATLEAHHLVAREGGRVRLGVSAHRLAGTVVPALRERARPVLAALAEVARASVHLCLAEGQECVAIATAEPTGSDLHLAYRSGARHPLERGAAGRAILVGRDGAGPRLVSSTGELRRGAHGLAIAVPGTSGLEAAVGVVSLRPLDKGIIEPHLRAAARLLATSG